MLLFKVGFDNTLLRSLESDNDEELILFLEAEIAEIFAAKESAFTD